MSKVDQLRGFREKRAAKSSRGGVEGHAGLDPKVAEAVVKSHRVGERPKAQVRRGASLARQIASGMTVPQAKSGSDKGSAAAATVPSAGIKPGPREAKPKKKSRSERASVAAPRKVPKGKGRQGMKPRASRVAAGRTAAQASGKPAPAVSRKVGRPRVEDRGKTLTDTKPWIAAKMSRATWYRRQGKPA